MTQDIGHAWGGDLTIGATGDLETVSPPDSVSQRIIRRLLTNRGDYIWSLVYGAGLTKFLGQPIVMAQIMAEIRVQMLRETSVATYPCPIVSIASAGLDRPGVFKAEISYWIAQQAEPVNLSILETA